MVNENGIDKKECEICGKKFNKTWFRTEGKYFCSDKHLKEYEDKQWKNMRR